MLPRTRRRSIRAAAVVSAALAAGLVLAGCSPATKSGGDEKSNASLNLAITNQPDSFDPAKISQSPDGTIWTALYDRLITQDPSGKYIPQAATSWKYSDNAKTLTLKLRDDLSFSDGKKADSSDVAATLKYQKDTPGQAQAGARYIASVDAPDKTSVVIKLTQPDPLLIDSLSTYLGVVADKATLGKESNALTPLESGPYTLDKSETVTGSKYVMKRRDNYWDAKDYPFATFTVKAITDQQALFNALQSGELDAGYAPSDQLASLTGSGYTNHVVRGQATGNLIIADRDGVLVPALKDVRVRQAINLAFDRKTIVAKLLSGSGQVAEQKIAPGATGYVKSLNSTYGFDVEKAKSLMAAAGYAKGFSVTMPSNFLSQTFEPTVTQALKDIGITVNWKVMQPTDPIWESKQFAMGFWYDSGTNGARAMLTNYDVNGNFNPFGATTPELTQLIKTASEETNADNAAKDWAAVNTYAVKNALSAPIFFTEANMVTKKGIDYAATVPPTITTVQLFSVSH